MGSGSHYFKMETILYVNVCVQFVFNFWPFASQVTWTDGYSLPFHSVLGPSHFSPISLWRKQPQMRPNTL